MKYKPHDYQKKAVKFMVSRGAAGLFLDPGLGKTSITYAAFRVLRKAGMVQKMLVIAPLRPATSTWPAEQKKWEDFHDLNVHVLHGKDKEFLLRTPHDISVVNPEGLEWLFKAAKREGVRWDMLVVDESTRFKHANTKRFKLLRPELPKFQRRYILTGSPAPNGLMDLFGQVYILDLGHALGQYITNYRNTYFDATGFGGYTWVPRSDSEEKIYDRLRLLVLRMAGEDYLDLPPLIHNQIDLELPESCVKPYREMEELLVAELEKETVTAASAAAATNKCRQIANGGIYHGGGKEYTNLHLAKAEAVAELVEELQGKPALVAYEYAHDLDRLRGVLGADTPFIGGGVPVGRFREIESAWNAGRIPVLLAQPQSVAHGLNLQGVGAAVIFHSIPWDLEVYEQLIRRVWRQGQKERVVVHHLVMKNTVDVAVMRALARKDRTQQSLLSALKASLRR